MWFPYIVNPLAPVAAETKEERDKRWFKIALIAAAAVAVFFFLKRKK